MGGGKETCFFKANEAKIDENLSVWGVWIY